MAAPTGYLPYPAGTAFLLKQDSTGHCKCEPLGMLDNTHQLKRRL